MRAVMKVKMVRVAGLLNAVREVRCVRAAGVVSVMEVVRVGGQCV
jgi:hypothetical protein